MFYKKTDNWNVPKTIDTTNVAATMVVKSYKSENTLEVLSIALGDFTNYQFDLNIAWDNTIVRVPIKLTNEEIMEKRISRTLSEPISDDFYSAAQYEMESGKNFKRGLKWINSAIENRENKSWWDLRIKAILLMELNKTNEAKKVAKTAFHMAEKENHEYGINEMKRILEELKK